MDNDLKPADWAEEQALFRLKVIGPLLCGGAMGHGELAAALRDLSQTRFRPPDAAVTRTYAVSTLERWLYAYRDGGLGALRPKRRSDRGHARALTDAQRELLLDIRRQHPRASASVIVRTLERRSRHSLGVLFGNAPRASVQPFEAGLSQPFHVPEKFRHGALPKQVVRFEIVAG